MLPPLAPPQLPRRRRSLDAPSYAPLKVPGFLRKVYEFYSDYVLKNPFYEIDMPIRIKLFESHVEMHARALGLVSAAPPAAPAAAAPALFVGASST